MFVENYGGMLAIVLVILFFVASFIWLKVRDKRSASGKAPACNPFAPVSRYLCDARRNTHVYDDKGWCIYCGKKSSLGINPNNY